MKSWSSRFLALALTSSLSLGNTAPQRADWASPKHLVSFNETTSQAIVPHLAGAFRVQHLTAAFMVLMAVSHLMAQEHHHFSPFESTATKAPAQRKPVTPRKVIPPPSKEPITTEQAPTVNAPPAEPTPTPAVTPAPAPQASPQVRSRPSRALTSIGRTVISSFFFLATLVSGIIIFRRIRQARRERTTPAFLNWWPVLLENVNGHESKKLETQDLETLSLRLDRIVPHMTLKADSLDNEKSNQIRYWEYAQVISLTKKTLALLEDSKPQTHEDWLEENATGPYTNAKNQLTAVLRDAEASQAAVVYAQSASTFEDARTLGRWTNKLRPTDVTWEYLKEVLTTMIYSGNDLHTHLFPEENGIIGNTFLDTAQQHLFINGRGSSLGAKLFGVIALCRYLTSSWPMRLHSVRLLWKDRERSLSLPFRQQTYSANKRHLLRILRPYENSERDPGAKAPRVYAADLILVIGDPRVSSGLQEQVNEIQDQLRLEHPLPVAFWQYPGVNLDGTPYAGGPVAPDALEAIIYLHARWKKFQAEFPHLKNVRLSQARIIVKGVSQEAGNYYPNYRTCIGWDGNYVEQGMTTFQFGILSSLDRGEELRTENARFIDMGGSNGVDIGPSGVHIGAQGDRVLFNLLADRVTVADYKTINEKRRWSMDIIQTTWGMQKTLSINPLRALIDGIYTGPGALKAARQHWDLSRKGLEDSSDEVAAMINGYKDRVIIAAPAVLPPIEYQNREMDPYEINLELWLQTAVKARELLKKYKRLEVAVRAHLLVALWLRMKGLALDNYRHQLLEEETNPETRQVLDGFLTEFFTFITNEGVRFPHIAEFRAILASPDSYYWPGFTGPDNRMRYITEQQVPLLGAEMVRRSNTKASGQNSRSRFGVFKGGRGDSGNLARVVVASLFSLVFGWTAPAPHPLSDTLAQANSAIQQNAVSDLQSLRANPLLATVPSTVDSSETLDQVLASRYVDQALRQWESSPTSASVGPTQKIPEPTLPADFTGYDSRISREGWFYAGWEMAHGKGSHKQGAFGIPPPFTEALGIALKRKWPKQAADFVQKISVTEASARIVWLFTALQENETTMHGLQTQLDAQLKCQSAMQSLLRTNPPTTDREKLFAAIAQTMVHLRILELEQRLYPRQVQNQMLSAEKSSWQLFFDQKNLAPYELAYQNGLRDTWQNPTAGDLRQLDTRQRGLVAQLRMATKDQDAAAPLDQSPDDKSLTVPRVARLLDTRFATDTRVGLTALSTVLTGQGTSLIDQICFLLSTSEHSLESSADPKTVLTLDSQRFSTKRLPMSPRARDLLNQAGHDGETYRAAEALAAQSRANVLTVLGLLPGGVFDRSDLTLSILDYGLTTEIQQAAAQESNTSTAGLIELNNIGREDFPEWGIAERPMTLAASKSDLPVNGKVLTDDLPWHRTTQEIFGSASHARVELIRHFAQTYQVSAADAHLLAPLYSLYRQLQPHPKAVAEDWQDFLSGLSLNDIVKDLNALAKNHALTAAQILKMISETATTLDTPEARELITQITANATSNDQTVNKKASPRNSFDIAVSLSEYYAGRLMTSQLVSNRILPQLRITAGLTTMARRLDFTTGSDGYLPSTLKTAALINGRRPQSLGTGVLTAAQSPLTKLKQKLQHPSSFATLMSRMSVTNFVDSEMKAAPAVVTPPLPNALLFNVQNALEKLRNISATFDQTLNPKLAAYLEANAAHLDGTIPKAIQQQLLIHYLRLAHPELYPHFEDARDDFAKAVAQASKDSSIKGKTEDLERLADQEFLPRLQPGQSVDIAFSGGVVQVTNRGLINGHLQFQQVSATTSSKGTTTHTLRFDIDGFKIVVHPGSSEEHPGKSIHDAIRDVLKNLESILLLPHAPIETPRLMAAA